MTDLHSTLASAGDREIVITDLHGAQTRGLIYSWDGERLRLLGPGDKWPTSPIPIASLARVRVLGPSTSAARRGLVEARKLMASAPGRAS